VSPKRTLSPRQRDVVALLVAGHTQLEIIRKLGFSRGTLRFHVRQVAKRIPGPGSPMRRVLLYARDLLDGHPV
jgi:DNA-binding CsgD family transcriptional regulator